jgi:hypothetical protein
MRQREQAQGRVIKKFEEIMEGSSSCVIFLGKERRRMMSLSRWWKEGEWVGCLGYFEKIKMSRIVLGT